MTSIETPAGPNSSSLPSIINLLQYTYTRTFHPRHRPKSTCLAIHTTVRSHLVGQQSRVPPLDGVLVGIQAGGGSSGSGGGGLSCCPPTTGGLMQR